MGPLGEAAVKLAQAGWAIFPCRPGSKLPAVKNWPDVATRELGQVREWWTRWPTANISTCPGRSGVVVLDLDGEAGFASWRDLQRRHGQAPPTATVASPRAAGGRHLYFTAPDGLYVRSTAGKVAPGVDVRGTRGQAVLPPSVRPEGAYRWATPGVPIAKPPAWLVDLLRPPPPPPAPPPGRLPASPSRRLEGLVTAVHRSIEGCPKLDHDRCSHGRNDVLHWAACRAGELAAECGDASTIARALVEAARVTGLGPVEAWATVRSGMNKAGARPGGAG